MKRHYLIVAFAILSFTSFGQQRVSLLETFTSSTCPPCNGGNQVLEGLLANAQNDGKNVSLKYQMNWPGNGDPYYTMEGDDRIGIYNITGIPATVLDGTTEINTGSLTQNNLNTVYGVTAKSNLSAVYQVNEATKTVDLYVDVEMLVNTNPGVRLYMAIFEYTTDNNVESNGETEFFHVMKKMIPGSGGKVMSPMTAGDHFYWTESYTFNGNYRLPQNSLDYIDNATENSVEEFSDLGVAVWVQTLLNKEVYQAIYAVPGIVGLNDQSMSIATAKIYPNPAANKATLAFQTTENQDITIEVINAFGQIMTSASLPNTEAGRTTHTINTSELPSGMYTVRISSDKGVLSERMAIEK